MQPKEKKPYQLSDYLNAINNTKERLMDSDDFLHGKRNILPSL